MISIQNSDFKIDRSPWRFNKEEMSPIYEQNTLRHTVTVINEYVYHYDYRDRN